MILRHTFTPHNNLRLTHLCGPADQHLRTIEAALQIQIAHRHEQFKIDGPKALGRWAKLYTIDDSKWAATIIVVATFPLMARYGTLVGPNVPQLLKAGVALVLQEAGNYWEAIAIAMPIALLLGLKREVIGASGSCLSWRRPTRNKPSASSSNSTSSRSSGN